MMRISRIAAGFCRLGACAVAIGTGVAIGLNSLQPKKPQSEKPVPTDVEAASPASVNTAKTQDQGAVQPWALEAGKAAITNKAENETSVQPSATDSRIEVAQWRFGRGPGYALSQSQQSDIVADRPVYLWMTLHGTQPAIDAMHSEHGLKIQVHWVRESATGAPNLVT